MRHRIGKVFLCERCAVVDSVGVSTCKEGMNSVLGPVSKALLMSIVARSVRCVGFGAFKPSCMCVVRSAVVECLALKP